MAFKIYRLAPVLLAALLPVSLGACAPGDDEVEVVEPTEGQLEALPPVGNTPGEDGFSQETGEPVDDPDEAPELGEDGSPTMRRVDPATQPVDPALPPEDVPPVEGMEEDGAPPPGS